MNSKRPQPDPDHVRAHVRPGTEKRNLGIQPPTPPGRRPPVPEAEPPAGEGGTEVVDPDDGGEGSRPSSSGNGRAVSKKRGGRSGDRQAATTEPERGDDQLPGVKRHRQREFRVHVSGKANTAVRDFAQREGLSLGEAVMVAARRAHAVLEKRYPERIAEGADGPYPESMERPRRRKKVEDGRRIGFYVPDAEAMALAQVADDFDVSISELVTEAIETALAVETAGTSS